ncbi:MAG: hypothetical protein WD056_00700 [Gemmatimonadota bacterium]
MRGRRPAGLLLLLLLGCDDTLPTSPAPGFGQVGEIQVDVRSPLGQALGGGVFQGTLQETLEWRSNGAWSLAERVSYNGVLGSETIRKSRLNPGELTDEYSALVTQLTEGEGTRLLGAVPQGLFPVCGSSSSLGLTTQVTVTIRDARLDESVRWVRCTYGILLSSSPTIGIDPSTAAPDQNAARVIAAATLIREAIFAGAATSTYGGTVPFATLARGETSAALPLAPAVFISSDGTAPQSFRDFWALHAGPTAPLPEVNWGPEVVVLAAVGPRDEAGDSVQVRRIVRIGVGQGSRVEYVERVPGDFCSPAAKRVYPYHLVAVPAVLFPLQFVAPEVERIPCGF